MARMFDRFGPVMYTISEVESSDRVDTPGMPEAKCSE